MLIIKLKNINSKIFILFIFFAGLVILLTTGCKKDTSPKTQNKTTLSALDSKINRMIKGFKTDMKSHLKDGEEISIDSVIWYIEASLNETYARADNSKEQIWMDSSFVNIPLAGNNTVLLSSIKDAYTELVSDLSDHYHSISGEKSLIYVDISFSSIQTDNLTLRMKDYIVSMPMIPVPTNWTFGPTDYWFWGEGMGRCGSYSGYIGQDASTRLTTYANGSLGIPGVIFYTDITTTPDIYPPDVPTTGNPYGYNNTLLFWCSGTPPEIQQCLSPDVMNYYLDNLKTIGSMYQPSGKIIVQYNCYWTISVGSDWDHLHFATVSYGIPVGTASTIEEL